MSLVKHTNETPYKRVYCSNKHKLRRLNSDKVTTTSKQQTFPLPFYAYLSKRISFYQEPY